MPELPEVETMRRGVLGIVGSRVVDAQRVPCRQKAIQVAPRIDALRRRVLNTTVRDVGRAGKRVVVWLDSDDALVIEPRMTGLALVVNPPNREHLRLRLRLSGGPHRELLYWDRRGLGSVRLFSDNEFQLEFGLEKLGPDALTMTEVLYRERLGRSKREIKVALLDQRAVAGIGNLYASEILHVAGVHPARRCDRMTHQQWRALTAATRHVLEEAIRYEGSTLADGTYRNALNKRGSYQNEHRVYAKAGDSCSRCHDGMIVRIVQAHRSTFFCPVCQRKSGVRTELCTTGGVRV